MRAEPSRAGPDRVPVPVPVPVPARCERSRTMARQRGTGRGGTEGCKDGVKDNVRGVQGLALGEGVPVEVQGGVTDVRGGVEGKRDAWGGRGCVKRGERRDLGWWEGARGCGVRRMRCVGVWEQGWVPPAPRGAGLQVRDASTLRGAIGAGVAAPPPSLEQWPESRWVTLRPGAAWGGRQPPPLSHPSLGESRSRALGCPRAAVPPTRTPRGSRAEPGYLLPLVARRKIHVVVGQRCQPEVLALPRDPALR